jgi:hypothetical protein
MVDSGVGLSYRPASLCNPAAGQYNNPMPKFYIPQSGTENFASAQQRIYDTAWVALETSFDSKRPKLEPKLVSALSETKLLFQFYTETESFGVSIEPKQTEEQPKQFDREHILVFCQKI